MFHNEDHKLKAVQDIIITYKQETNDDMWLTQFMGNTPIEDLWVYINLKLDQCSRTWPTREVSEEHMKEILDLYASGNYKSINHIGKQYWLSFSQVRNLINNTTKLQ